MCLCILHNFSNLEIRLDPATLVFWLTFQMVHLLFMMATAKNPAMQKYDTINRNVTLSNNKTVNDLAVCTMSNRCCLSLCFPVAPLECAAQGTLAHNLRTASPYIHTCLLDFPNPFHTSKMISFTLSQGGHQFFDKWSTLSVWCLMILPLVHKETGPKRKFKHNSTDNCNSEKQFTYL